MPITQIPSRQVFPTQPKVANLNQVASATTYYTVLNLTSGRGILSRVVLTTASGISGNANLQVRVTIDGVANILSTSFNNYAFGLNHSNTAGSAEAEKSIDLFLNTNFYNSLQVEIYTTASLPTLVSTVFYQIE